ncbi:putative membrane protein [Emiliania huxleyi virus 145]|nr:putative membrane protein [Emiliania huxleyi virus 145]
MGFLQVPSHLIFEASEIITWPRELDESEMKAAVDYLLHEVLGKSTCEVTCDEVHCPPLPPFCNTFSLRIEPTAGQKNEYRTEIDLTNYGAGEYILSADVYFSDDFDGVARVTHSRWYDANSQDSIFGATSPTPHSQWRSITDSITVSFNPTYMQWFVGFPVESTTGYVWITNLQVTAPNGDLLIPDGTFPNGQNLEQYKPVRFPDLFSIVPSCANAPTPPAVAPPPLPPLSPRHGIFEFTCNFNTGDYVNNCPGVNLVTNVEKDLTYVNLAVTEDTTGYITYTLPDFPEITEIIVRATTFISSVNNAGQFLIISVAQTENQGLSETNNNMASQFLTRPSSGNDYAFRHYLRSNPGFRSRRHNRTLIKYSDLFDKFVEFYSRFVYTDTVLWGYMNYGNFEEAVSNADESNNILPMPEQDKKVLTISAESTGDTYLIRDFTIQVFYNENSPPPSPPPPSPHPPSPPPRHRRRPPHRRPRRHPHLLRRRPRRRPHLLHRPHRRPHLLHRPHRHPRSRHHVTKFGLIQIFSVEICPDIQLPKFLIRRVLIDVNLNRRYSLPFVITMIPVGARTVILKNNLTQATYLVNLALSHHRRLRHRRLRHYHH